MDDSFLDNFEKISLTDSLLYKKVYRSEKILQNHFDSYLKDDFDTIAVFKFSEHLPDILTVSQNLEVLHHLQILSASLENGDEKSILSFRVIRILERDWFVEVCAALGGLGGLAAVIQLIITIINNGKVTKVEKVPQVRQYPTSTGFIQKTTVYVEQKVEQKYLDSQNIYSIEEISEYYNKYLCEIQLYTKTGKFSRVIINSDNRNSKQ